MSHIPLFSAGQRSRLPHLRFLASEIRAEVTQTMHQHEKAKRKHLNYFTGKQQQQQNCTHLKTRGGEIMAFPDRRDSALNWTAKKDAEIISTRGGELMTFLERRDNA